MKKTVVFLLVLTMVFSMFSAFTVANAEGKTTVIFEDDFSGYDQTQTYTGQGTLMEKNWKIASTDWLWNSTAGKSFGYGDGVMKIQANCPGNGESTKYTATNLKAFPTAELAVDTSKLGTDQKISVKATKNNASNMWGVRFYVHGSGTNLNYYTLYFGGQFTNNAAGTGFLTWGLYKSAGGTVTTLKEKSRSSKDDTLVDTADGYMGVGTATLNIEVSGNDIIWNLDYVKGETTYSYSETYTDAGMFDVSEQATTVHLYAGGIQDDAARTVSFGDFSLASVQGEEYAFHYNSAKEFATTVPLQYAKDGYGLPLGNSSWRSMTEAEGKMGTGNNSDFEIKNNAMYLKQRVSSRPSAASDSFMRYNGGDLNIPALVYRYPSHNLTGDQTIKFTVGPLVHATTSVGVRFKVHNSGHNYYAIVFGGDYIYPNDGGTTLIGHKIYKFVDNAVPDGAYKEATRDTTTGNYLKINEQADVIVTCEGATISFIASVKNSKGEILRTITDSWTDPSPFGFGNTDEASVMFTAGGAYGNNDRIGKYSFIDIKSNPAEEAPHDVISEYDDGALKYELKATYVGETLKAAVAKVKGFSADITEDEDKKTVVVPEEVTAEDVTYTVTEIGAGAFRGSIVEKVTLPDTLTTISENAFRACDNLWSINIPEQVTYLPRGAFYKVGRINGLNITFEGKEIAFASGEAEKESGVVRQALCISDETNKKIKAYCCHPDVKDTVQTYFETKYPTVLWQYVAENSMLYKDGKVKFYAPADLENGMLIIGLYDLEEEVPTLESAKIDTITANKGDLVEYSLSEHEIDISDVDSARAFLWSGTETLNPMTVPLDIK